MILKPTLTAIFTLSILSLFAFNTKPITYSKYDSMVLSKNGSTKDIVITANQKIKVKRKKQSTVSGDFMKIKEGILTLRKGKSEFEILVNDIEEIKVLSKPFTNTLGTAFILLGGSAMALGGISLIAGIMALSSSNLGAVILVAVPVLAGGGFGIFKLGQGLTGKKYHMDDWTINMN